MRIITDTREQDALSFTQIDGVEYETATIDIGDYALSIDGQLAPIRIERKSIADLFSSFSGDNYDRERAKILRAKEHELRYIIAIEASALEVRKGHTYTVVGEVRESKKSGIAQVRQLMTIAHKYNVEVWYCEGRRDMAFRIQEYFLAYKRLKDGG